MPQFRTQYTENERSFDPSSSEVLTVPDMSLSVKDIITRFTRGTLDQSDIYRPGDYDEDPDIDNPVESPTDLTDYDRMMQRGHEILQSISSHSPDGSSHQPPIDEPKKERSDPELGDGGGEALPS